MVVFSWVGCWTGYPPSHCYRCQHRGRDWAGAAPIYITAGFCVTRASSLLVIWGGFICFLPSWMNFSRVVLIFTLVEKGALVSVLLSQGADLRRLARCVRSPKHSKVTTGENQCELFCAKRGGSNSRPACVAFKVSKRKPGGSIPGVLGLRSCDWQGMPEELEPSAGNWMTGV